MAKLEEGILGGFRGGIGPVIGYRWKDKWCIRARPTHVHNPRTAAQTAHRTLFREMVQLAAVLKEGLRLGLRQMADREGMTVMNAFCRLNWDEHTGVAYDRLCVSEGPVAPVQFHVAQRDGDVMRATFAPNPTGRQASPTDSVRLLVFNATRRESLLTAAVGRHTGTLAVALPTGWTDDELHLYGFVQDDAGRCSPSTYIDSLTPRRQDSRDNRPGRAINRDTERFYGKQPDSTMQQQQVFCPVRRRRVALTPEEGVRQHTIAMLHDLYGYPLELMQVEGAISLYGMTRRCDIVVYDTGGRPQIIVECKRPDVPLTQKVCDQACRYNTVLHVPLLLLTNGNQQVVLEVDFASSALRQLPDVPLCVKEC